MTKKEQLKRAFKTIIIGTVSFQEQPYDDKEVDETVNELLKEVSIRTPLK